MLEEILKILFPSPCVVCGYLGELLCDRCFYKLKFEPHIRELEGLNVCTSMYFEKNSAIEKIIYFFKYEHYRSAYKSFIPHMKKSLELMTDLNNLLFVPVPLHKKRELERGYNQAEVIAKTLAKSLGFECRNLLYRVKNTKQQAKSLGKKEREENMEGAFRLNGTDLSLAQVDLKIVLVDDIVTTGATLIECKETLRKAGAQDIIALTIADREKTNFRN